MSIKIGDNYLRFQSYHVPRIYPSWVEGGGVKFVRYWMALIEYILKHTDF